MSQKTITAALILGCVAAIFLLVLSDRPGETKIKRPG